MARTNDEYRTSETGTQTQLIKAHLEAGKTITPLEALELFGCFRLGARIWDLRHEHGMDIQVRQKPIVGKNGASKRIAEYYLGRAQA